MRKYFLLLIILMNTTIYCEGANKAGFPEDHNKEYYGFHKMEDFVPYKMGKDNKVKKNIPEKIKKKDEKIHKDLRAICLEIYRNAQKEGWRYNLQNYFSTNCAVYSKKQGERVYFATVKVLYPQIKLIFSILRNGKVVNKNERDDFNLRYGILYEYYDFDLFKYKDFYVFTGENTSNGYLEEESLEGTTLSMAVSNNEEFIKLEFYRSETYINEQNGWKRVNSPYLEKGGMLFKNGAKYVKVKKIYNSYEEFTLSYTFYKEELSESLNKKYLEGIDYYKKEMVTAGALIVDGKYIRKPYTIEYKENKVIINGKTACYIDLMENIERSFLEEYYNYNSKIMDNLIEYYQIADYLNDNCIVYLSQPCEIKISRYSKTEEGIVNRLARLDDFIKNKSKQFKNKFDKERALEEIDDSINSVIFHKMMKNWDGID